MTRPMSQDGPPPPSPLCLRSPAICRQQGEGRRPGLTPTRPLVGPSSVQEARMPVLPESEGLFRVAYDDLAAGGDEQLQEIAG
jgi:hypothetical protein